MLTAPVVASLMGAAPDAGANGPTFTVATMPSGVQALRDAKPSSWWLSGITFVDLDHDGDLDLFMADHDGTLGMAAINDGKGNFTAAGGNCPTTEIHMCLDVDEDGKVDMDMTYTDGGARWWLNQTATGSSTLKLTDAGNGDTRGGNQSRSEALVDINRDGKLDWVRGAQGSNFHVDFGDGKGNFAADSVLIPQPMGDAEDSGIMFADVDADGDEDMIVNWGGYSAPGGDDYGRMRLLVNDGKMNFSEQTTQLGLPTDHFAVLGVGDVDQDGDVDLIGMKDRQFPEIFYINDGTGHFTASSGAVTGVTGSAEYALWGLATITDLDNDGIADILIDGRVFFHVLHGTGGGHFVYQNDAWGGITHTAEASVDSGFAFGDIDGDGDLDLMGYTAGDPDRQVALYRNDLPAQSWVNVRPVGLPGNKEGVNSKIRLYEAGTDHLLWFEEVLQFSKQAQQNYYAFDQLERHFGLGTKATVDVTVTFYPSGTTVRKNGVAANTTVTIGEDGTNGIVEPPASHAEDGGSSGGGSTADASSPEAGGPSGVGDSGLHAESSGERGESGKGCACRLGPAGTPGGDAMAAVALLILGTLLGARRVERR
ncbi:MAG: FG-GAP repeat domain-containing protein [Polyangiaceae bacterium]